LTFYYQHNIKQISRFIFEYSTGEENALFQVTGQKHLRSLMFSFIVLVYFLGLFVERCGYDFAGV